MTTATKVFPLALLLCIAACHGKKSDKDTTTQATSGGPAVAPVTEAEIVGALTGTTDALMVADSAAAASIESPGINSYAVVLRADHRAIGQEIRAVADTIKVAGATGPIADRLRNEAQQIATVLADTTVERGPAFVDAQIAMQKHLIGAMDSIFIPGAKAPALRQVLQDLRPAMVAHLQRAEQLKQILAAAAAAEVPRVAARISPDSARAPGDTTGKPPVRGDSGKVRTDTLHRNR